MRQAGQYQEVRRKRQEAGWPVSGGNRNEAGGRGRLAIIRR